MSADIERGPRSRNSRPLRIGIFGPYTTRNLGDTAIQMAVMGNLRRRFGDPQFLAISWDPEDALRYYGIPAVHLSEGSAQEPAVSEAGSIIGRLLSRCASFSGWNRFRRAWRISKVVRTLDLLVISGSGQLDDFWGGPWRHPYALLLWSLLARAHGVPVCVFGIGLDDLSTKLGRLFAFSAMRLVQQGYVRDQGTLDALRDMRVDSVFRAGPDPAFGVPEHLPSLATTAGERSHYLVCPISRKAWLRETSAAYEAYLETLTSACASLAREGARVRLAYSQLRDDRPVTLAVYDELRKRAGDADVRVLETNTVASFVAAAAEADVVVASRLHALIMAASVATPIVALAYGRKVKQLMVELQLQQMSLDLSTLDQSALDAALRRAWKERDETRAALTRIVDEYRRRLEVEYQAVVNLAAGGGLVAARSES